MIQTNRRPQIVAHRGFSGQYPENTRAAILAAIHLGVDMVEVDVRRSKDGVPVLCHNSRVDKTSDGKGQVASLTFAELRRLDMGGWKDIRFRGERIPSLDEVLLLAKGRIRLNLDIKEVDALPRVLRAVRRYDMAEEVVLSGCTWKTVRLVRESAPWVSVLLNADKTIAALSYLSLQRVAVSLLIWQSTLCRAAGVNLAHSRVKPPDVRRLNQNNQPVWAWTVDKQSHARKLARIGVASITTNHPDRIMAAFSSC